MTLVSPPNSPHPSSEIHWYNARMAIPSHLCGVFAAAVTPLNMDYSIAVDDFPILLSFLARRGCHGVLLFGTTGEGPSFSPAERLTVLRAARSVRQIHPEFRLLFGTGTPSLQETVDLTRDAFELGADGVVVLPPYYYRNVSEDGLYTWFSQVIRRAVPPGGSLLGYHFPKISGVPLTLNLLERLKSDFPERFAGIKDSSGDPEHARLLGQRFGKDLLVLTGNDSLFSTALENHACGCITALANLNSPDLRAVWDAWQSGDRTGGAAAQARLNRARATLENYQPFAPSIKAVINHKHRFRRWAVRPPLLPLSLDAEKQLMREITAAGEDLAN